MKRIVIYAIYDKENIIDRYALYIAQELKKVSDKLVIVAIGKYNQQELRKIKSITKDIYIRDNKGYDSGAYKDALCGYVGWDVVLQYDELVICNDTFYGPFWGFEAVFEKMSRQKCDYWGFTRHDATERFPIHVQSYFLTFRSKLLHDSKFREYWEKLKYPTNYDEARDYFEMAISTVFPKLGYTFATYVNEIENNVNRDVAYDCVNWRSFYATERLHCPIMKKKRFVEDLQLSDDISKLLEYIEKHSNYDVSMIWENVIRNYTLAQINCGYHLHHVFPFKNKIVKKSRMTQVHVIAVIDEGNDAKMYIDRIASLPSEVVVDVIVSDMNLKKYIEKKYARVNVIVSLKSVNIFRYLLVDTYTNLYNSDYLLFISNRRILDLKQQQFNEEMAQNNIWDNLMLNKAYIEQIVEFLNNNDQYGILFPNRDEFIMGDAIPYDWDKVHEHIDYLSNLLDTPEVLADNVGGRFLSHSFWIRTKILKKLRKIYCRQEISANDSNWEKAIQFVLPFFGKNCGYLPLIIENQRYAAMLRKRPSPPQITVKEQYIEKYLKLYKVNLNHFIEQCKYIYIYGAGKIADQVTELLNECDIPFDGYVVSDGQSHEREKGSHFVREFSDTLELDSCGYIIAVGEKLRPEVLQLLKNKGIHKYYVL